MKLFRMANPFTVMNVMNNPYFVFYAGTCKKWIGGSVLSDRNNQ